MRDITEEKSINQKSLFAFQTKTCEKSYIGTYVNLFMKMFRQLGHGYSFFVYGKNIPGVYPTFTREISNPSHSRVYPFKGDLAEYPKSGNELARHSEIGIIL